MARFDLDAELAQTDKLLGLPSGLSRAQIQVESGFNPRAVSPAGAMGLAQVMPATLKTLSQRLGRDLDPYSPQDAVQIQREVLRENLSKFRDPAKALMAYNGGWDPAKWNNPETQAYVGKIQGAMRGGGSVMAQAADKVMSAVSGTANAATGDLSAKVKQARDAGYSDDEIFSHLSQSQGFADKLQKAKDAGYSDVEIRQHFGLGQPAAAATSRPAQAAGPAKPAKSEGSGFLDGAGNFVRGLGQSVVDTVAGPAQLIGNSYVGLVNKLAPDSEYAKAITRNANETNALVRQQEQEYQAATPGSVAAGTGRVLGNVGIGLAAGGGKAMQTAGQVGELIPFVAGAGRGAQTAGRVAGTAAAGAGLGAASGALAPVTEEGDYTQNKLAQIAMGAGVGAALPVAGQAAGSAGRYVGRSARSLIEPFTEAGQSRIAANLLQRFAQGGPTYGNAAEIVPGSTPTLAQATGNSGLGALELGFRSANPLAKNVMEGRETANAAARTAAAQGATGTADDLATAVAQRSANAADDYLKTHIGIPVANTEYEALKQTPAFRAAMARAQAMARNAGTSVETQVQNRANANRGGAAGQPETYVSGQGLQIIKEALDDQIDKAIRAGAGKQAANIRVVKDRLVALMDNQIPGYADARAAYAEASRPIDAMKFLQGLNLTDAQGNITLNKVQNALKNLDKQRGLPGAREAKSVTQQQIDALTAIRDDLLRVAEGSGRAPGSPTFQNLATNNILENALPGPVRALMGGTQGPVGTLAGRVGNLIYGGANENIQNRLLNMMMNPQSGLNALQNVGGNQLAGPLGGNALLQRLAPNLLPAATIGVGVNARQPQ